MSAQKSTKAQKNNAGRQAGSNRGGATPKAAHRAGQGGKAKKPSASLAGKGTSKAAPRSGGKPAGAPQGQDSSRTGILDLRIKHELIGIIIAVLAIALFIAVVAPGTAILSSLTSDAFRLIFGLGAFILPFLLLIWAASFFVESGVASSTLRLFIGLAIIFISALAIIALLTPNAAADPYLIFHRPTLMSYGGYIGGFFAWALLSLVGKAISLVIFIGLVIVGAVLIGFSITGLVTRIMNQLSNRAAQHDDDTSFSAYDLMDTPSQGRASRTARAKVLTATAQLAPDLEPTRVLNGDFSQGDQGRIPYEQLDYPDDQGDYGDPGDPGDLDDLGATRRSQALQGDAAQESRPPAAVGQANASPASGNHPDSVTAGDTPTLILPPETPFTLPPFKLLKVSRNKAATKAGESELRRTAAVLQETIDQFGVDAQVQGWVAGPTVTLFKVSLGEGVRLNKINALDEDIALALAAPAVRIFSPIPGTTLVGIEVPNVNRSMILLGDVLPDSPDGPLQLAIGKDVEGSSIVANLEKMPHLLIGGTTGSGKSVAINSMIMSILMRATPSQVRMILIDPKMVELSLYNDIPHLYVPVVTDAQKAASALAWGVLEMERRLKIFQKCGVKNLEQYNIHVRSEQERLAQEAQKLAEKEAAQLAKQQATQLEDNNDGDGDDRETVPVSPSAGVKGTVPLTPGTSSPEELPQEMPLIVIVIDELADLMMVAGKDVETSISRLAQLARAAGLHIIIATQRPSTNVITGLIKANIVNRIAFSVASGIDSRVIIDGPGAEDLIGNGDLLFSRPEYGKPQRIQGCFVSEPEIEAVVDWVKEQAQPEYHEDILSVAVGGMSVSMMGDGGGGEDDPLVWEAAEIIVSSGFGSTSTLQRRLKVGYARAGRIMDMLEQKGIVGPPNGSKPREVLIDDVLDLESLKAIEAADDQW